MLPLSTLIARYCACLPEAAGSGITFSADLKNFLKVLIVSQGFAFQRLDFAGQFVHGQEHPAHSDESAHDFDVDGDGARAAQHAGKHGNAFLGKGVGQIPASAAPV